MKTYKVIVLEEVTYFVQAENEDEAVDNLSYDTISSRVIEDVLIVEESE